MAEEDDMKELFRAKALYDYAAEDDTELTLAPGAEIVIFKTADNGWWFGEGEDGACGWMPSNFVEKLGEEELAAKMEEAVLDDPTPATDDPTGEDSQPPTEFTHLDPLSDLPIMEDGTGCAGCNREIPESFIMAMGREYHPECFKCTSCLKDLSSMGFIEKDGMLFCEEDYHKNFSPKCGDCKEPITAQYITALDQTWHPECFVCAVCREPFPDGKFRKFEDKPFCEDHFQELFAEKCTACKRPVLGKAFEVNDKSFHPECFKCVEGGDDEDNPGHTIPEGMAFHEFEDKLYCDDHFKSKFFEKCAVCNDAIVEDFVTVMSKNYHVACFNCNECTTSLRDGRFDLFQDRLLCLACSKKAKADSTAHAKGALPSKPQPQPKAKPQPVQPNPSSPPSKVSAPRDPSPKQEPTKAPEAVFGTMKASSAVLTNAATDDASDPKVSYDPFEDHAHKLEELKNVPVANLPAGVDPARRELYLEGGQFKEIFGMAKHDFLKLKDWKKKQLKKKFGLY